MAVPAAAAPANIAQALQDHDRAKRSTDIPLYYGQIGKDTIAARLLIVRINDAGAIANWNNDRKLLEFKMCLRDKAVGWFEGLTEDGVATDNWDTVKAEFLETYEPKYSAKTTCANFTDLTQKSEESIKVTPTVSRWPTSVLWTTSPSPWLLSEHQPLPFKRLKLKAFRMPSSSLNINSSWPDLKTASASWRPRRSPSTRA